jgi:tRNA U34 2-thiouridine synthase MnmA/TrmU
MNEDKENIRGLGLCSGGLDSILAALVLKKQGVQVQWVSFETPFFSAAKAKKASRLAGIPLMVENITEIYLEMLKNPNCGYGKHMNPCMDCHALMFRLAGEIMRRQGFHFLFSGEVLGQRPMSQTRPSLHYVEKHSGMKGYILRPLCAKRLDETIPEKNGWVDRSGLLDITGRGRKRQIELAKQFGVTEYPAPAGGCLLTDKGYSRRLKDLLDRGDDPSERHLTLLKHGRHFRSASGVKIIVGRTRSDNEKILAARDRNKDLTFKVLRYPGPVCLIPGPAGDGEKTLAAAICAGYSKAPESAAAQVAVDGPGGSQTLTVLPVAPADVRRLMI